MSDNFPRYVELTKSTVYISLVARATGAISVAFPFLYAALSAPPLPRGAALVLAIALTALIVGAVCLIFRCVHRLLSYYHASMRSFKKSLYFHLCMLFPLLELRFLFDRDAWKEDISVPAFWQPAAKGDHSRLFTAIHFFLEGIPQPDSIAKGIRAVHRYFAGVHDDAVVIATEEGEFVARLFPNLYISTAFAPSNGVCVNVNGWRVERSESDAALVFEHSYEDLLAEDEETIASLIADAIDAVVKELKH